MRKRGLFLHLLTLLLVLQFLAATPTVANAAYSVGFANSNIRITSPGDSGQSFDGRVTITGTSELEQIFICIRGPQKEVSVAPVQVSNGEFAQEIVLRFGPGTYTFWAGDNAKKFDGSIRFEVINEIRQDVRFLAPSAYVDSENERIVELAASLVSADASDAEKLVAVHDWLVNNITYDVDAYRSRNIELKTASQTLADEKGLCRDYAFLTCALFRAMDLPAKVVYGTASGLNGRESHAWNEVLVNNKWVALDTTWDAGYIKNNRFVAAPSKKYLNPQQTLFSQTHQQTMVTVY